MEESDIVSQYSRCSEPIEISVEIEVPTTLIYIDGPILNYEPVQNNCNMLITFHFDPPSTEGIHVRSKSFEIPETKVGATLELFRNHPERIVQWCAENGNPL